MKRFAMILVLLAAIPAVGGVTILRRYTMGKQSYAVCVLQDGSHADMKVAADAKEGEILAKAQVCSDAIAAAKAIVAADDPSLSRATTEQIKAEVAKRKLTAADLGLTTQVMEVPR